MILVKQTVDPPHINVKRLWLVDLKAATPCAVGDFHEAHAQQLVKVISGPVENNAGARQRGDIPLWVAGTLKHICLADVL